MDKILKNIPVIALRGLVIFPDTVTNIDIAREKSLAVINDLEDNGEYVAFSSQLNPLVQNPSEDDLLRTCVLGRVQSITGGKDLLKIKIVAEKRGKILDFIQNDRKFVADVEVIEEVAPDAVRAEALTRILENQLAEYVKYDKSVPRDTLTAFFTENDTVKLINVLSSALLKSDEDKVRMLETVDNNERLDLLIGYVGKELEIFAINKDIARKVQQSVEANQKEYYLREQMRVISDELGDDIDECEEYRKKIHALGIENEDTLDKLDKEVNRLSKLQPNSPDSGVIRSYLDWIIDIPWKDQSQDNNDIIYAKKVLDEDHYGLEKVKERILEYLSVKIMTGNSNGSVLCLVGPPGVGKTSIAKSIARATGRNFVRMSLGGIRDESEIRGHRRTYVGAMPGRIIYNMRNSKTINPVFLLDEIDKMTSDFRGDPASALLEVLDPEINSTFRDNFIEVPYDLSKVFFITTANSLDTISAPLLDRMEIIELSGYTADEKREIAKRYLVKKAISATGLSADKVELSDAAIDDIISHYTRESGVRTLERTIEKVFRKVDYLLLTGEISLDEKLVINDVEKYLGVRKYIGDEPMKNDTVGTAIGLAWTSVGGVTLNVEASVMSGKGEIILTGKLGDVMKESARTAISYIHANAEKLGVPENYFADKDIHLHVPEGATPKDGPSAGITIATAILSAITKKPVDHSVAMTGEITLRGNVLPIGGLKEKLLAASRVGIKKAIIPFENERDFTEMPAEVTDKLEIIPVKTVGEVFERAILC